MTGQGEIIMIDGEKYKGGYKNGNKHGSGTSSYVDGEVYKGEYVCPHPLLVNSDLTQGH